ncbi:MAG: polyamine aminopropyltransferase [Verrucomicrobia bacterium]|nr:polyamine aminopropyltransferase [Verrucomicrobiota bacterium]|tara:strand:+ start:22783 stop:24465 length:1683 start_codon:yes stop_codon:yes gene_type:complete
MPENTPTPSSKKHISPLWLSLLMFLLGGCGLAYEYTLSKIASDLLGNSVQQWATMIATMLFAMGLGADIQKRVGEKALADLLLRSQLWLAILGGCGPLILIVTFAEMPEQYIFVQYLLALIVGTLIGFEIPLIMRLNESEKPDMRMNLAQVLKMDYIGALLGALVWTFLMIRFLGIERISFLLGAITLVAAAVSAYIFRHRLERKRLIALEFVIALSLVVGGLIYGKDLALKAEQRLYRDPIVFSETTPYQHIVLTRDRRDTLRCYINGHLQFDSDDEFIYHEQLVHPVMELAPQATSILVLGGGDGLAVRELLKYPRVTEITLVDIDPKMTDLAAKNKDFVSLNHGSLTDASVNVQPSSGISEGANFTLQELNHRRALHQETEPTADLHILNVDAASFVRSAPGSYDVMILDFPDPSSPDLAKLYGRPFYEALKDHLAPGGFIVQQSGSPFHAKEAFLCVGRTLAASGFQTLPYHDNVPSFGEWGWWLAWKNTGSDEQAIARRLRKTEKLTAPTLYLTPGLVRASLEFGKGQLSSKNTDITSLTQPTIYHHYLEGWQTR